MTITPEQLTEIAEGDRYTVDDFNLLIRAVKQALAGGGGGGGGGGGDLEGPTLKLTVGTETWTIAGHKLAGGDRYILIKYADVASISPSTADEIIVTAGV